MKVEKIIKERQPKDHKKLKEMSKKSKRKNKKELTEDEIKDLMYHPAYKRGSRGAIKQVR